MKSIPTYSCPRSADVPLAPGSEESPSPRASPRILETNHPLLAGKPIRAKLGALIAAIAFRGRFSGTRSRADLGTTPQKRGGVALFAFFEVTLQRTPPPPPPPSLPPGTFPSAQITTTWNGARRGAGWRRFPKFRGPSGSASSPLKTRSGAAPRTCSWRDLGHKHQPHGAKMSSKAGKLPRAAGKGLSVCRGGCARPGWGQSLFSIVSELSFAARHEFPTPPTAMSPLFRLPARWAHGRFCNDFDEKRLF